MIPPASEVIDQIKEHGLIKLPKFVDNINPILNEFDAHIDRTPDRSENTIRGGSLHRDGAHNIGKIIKIQSDSYGSIPNIHGLFNTEYFKEIVKLFYGHNYVFMLQVYLGHDYHVLDKSQWPRNAHSHFDPFQAIKFMLYLTPCTKDNGAFRYIPDSHHYGKSTRESYNLENLLSSAKYTLEANPCNEFREKDMTYCDGEPGDLLIFDTDVLHGGGTLLQEGERKSIIIHNRQQ